jgi:hypothetical protein
MIEDRSGGGVRERELLAGPGGGRQVHVDQRHRPGLHNLVIPFLCRTCLATRAVPYSRAPAQASRSRCALPRLAATTCSCLCQLARVRPLPACHRRHLDKCLGLRLDVRIEGWNWNWNC